MKRPLIAAIFLIAVLVLNVACLIYIDDVFGKMEISLSAAYSAAITGDSESAKKSLEEFDNIFERNEHALSLFVRRELVYDIAEAGSTLESYLDSETATDFNSNVKLTLELMREARDVMFKLS
ncbi:MAG: DUF4363 family protein [Oscillospiraceae bacterium]